MIRLRVLLTERDVEAAEAVSGLSALGWGGVVCLPFRSFPLSQSLGLMDRWAPEEWWGAAVCVLGLAQLALLLSDRRAPRRAAALAAATMWLFLASLLGYSSTWMSPGAASFLVLFLASGWVFVRLGGSPPWPRRG